MDKLGESIRKRLKEVTTPNTGLDICVALLNTITNSNDFDKYLATHVEIHKDGKSRIVHDYVLHHIDGKHDHRDINNICIIKRKDHDAMQSKGEDHKDFEDCDRVEIREYLSKFLSRVEDEILD